MEPGPLPCPSGASSTLEPFTFVPKFSVHKGQKWESLKAHIAPIDSFKENQLNLSPIDPINEYADSPRNEKKEKILRDGSKVKYVALEKKLLIESNTILIDKYLAFQDPTSRREIDLLQCSMARRGLRPIACPCCFRLFSRRDVKQVQSHIISEFYLKSLDIDFMVTPSFSPSDPKKVSQHPHNPHNMKLELLCKECDNAMGEWESGIKKDPNSYYELLDLAKDGTSTFVDDSGKLRFSQGQLFRFILPNLFRMLWVHPQIHKDLWPILDSLRRYLRYECVDGALPFHKHHTSNQINPPHIYAIPITLQIFNSALKGSNKAFRAAPILSGPFLFDYGSTMRTEAPVAALYFDPFIVVASLTPIPELNPFELSHCNRIVGPTLPSESESRHLETLFVKGCSDFSTQLLK